MHWISVHSFLMPTTHKKKRIGQTVYEDVKYIAEKLDSWNNVIKNLLVVNESCICSIPLYFLHKQIIWIDVLLWSDFQTLGLGRKGPMK